MTKCIKCKRACTVGVNAVVYVKNGVETKFNVCDACAGIKRTQGGDISLPSLRRMYPGQEITRTGPLIRKSR